jgi:hypothetical protein
MSKKKKPLMFVPEPQLVSGSPACCGVDLKEILTPQSDDQFFVWNYVTDHDIPGYLSRRPNGLTYTTMITVPSLGLNNATPFDYYLHQVAERLRAA